MQKQLVDAGRKLNETTAGKALYTQFQKFRHGQKEIIKQLQEDTKAREDPGLVRRLEMEQRHSEAEMQKTWDDMDRLKISGSPFSTSFPKGFNRRVLRWTILHRQSLV